MKRYTFTLFFLFLILSNSNLFAGNTVLTTFYPPPKGAYNTVQLSTNHNATSAVTISSPTSCNDTTTIFLNSATGTLYKCSGPGTAAAFCTLTTTGSVLVDSVGNLHACTNINGMPTDTIYPQQCYNSFCSYDTYPGVMPPSSSNCTPSPICAQGYFQWSNIDGVLSDHDTFQTGPYTFIKSYVCCSIPQS